ncbi:MAG: carboxypeptidase-like regulatory domain-containing protein [Thermoanaerobaculia bacterium]|nr:carboxypeptidase-like regulatory domain-containing protein [Thermoanaerobaculia bacterium]
MVRAQAASGDHAPVSKSVDAPGLVQLPLEPGRLWELAADSPGLWSPGVALFVTEEAPRITLDMFQAASLEGKVGVAAPDEIGTELSIRFRGHGSEGSRIGENTEDCELGGDGRFKCRVPRVKLDLRVRMPGFASKFVWDVDARTVEKLDLGVLSLERGASIVGTVETHDGAPVLDTAKVELIPVVGQPLVGDRRGRAALLATSHPIDSSGFFHLVGLSPGSYKLQASQPGYAPSTLGPIALLANTESEIARPLTLFRPISVQIEVRPAASADNEPWQVEVLTEGAYPGHRETVKPRTPVPDSGILTIAEVRPGIHYIRLYDAEGSRIASQEVEVANDGQLIDLELDLVAVEGEVTLDDEPLLAELWFGGRHGPQRVLARSNEVGWFESVLPRSGSWTIDVRAEFPKVNRRLDAVLVEKDGEDPVRLDLLLSDYSISGRIIDAEGRRVRSRLFLTLWKVGDERTHIFQDVTSDEGTFEVHGLEDGLYRVTAEGSLDGRPVVSETVSVRAVRDFGSSAAELVVSFLKTARGLVRSSHGPVPLAKVLGNPLAGGMTVSHSFPEALTDVQGRFELLVPERTEHADFIVLAPGHGLQVFSILEPFEQTAVLEVSRRAGVIRLDLKAANREADSLSGSPILIQDGKIMISAVLRSWAFANGERNTEMNLWTLPAMAPGFYQACLVSQVGLQDLRVDELSAGPRGCVGGFLQPDGLLDLTWEEP